MPTKYSDRLNLPVDGNDSIRFYTQNGLLIATGYQRVVFGDISTVHGMTKKQPYVEFTKEQLNLENIAMPSQQKWRVSNKASLYIEYRSRDYCNVKIMEQKSNDRPLKQGMCYISPFDLRSDQVPVLIEPLRRRRTLASV